MTVHADDRTGLARSTASGTVILASVAATVAAILTMQWIAARTGSSWSPGGDLAVYRDAVGAALADDSPYGISRNGYGFVYPPFALLALAPLAWLGPAVGFWGWTVVSTLAVPAVVWLLIDHLTPAGDRQRPGLLAAGTLAALPLSPIAATLLLGNVNIFLLALLLADLLLITGRHQGVLVGLAAGIKLTPLLFVGYLLLTRRTRAGLVALLSFVGTVGVGFLLLPAASGTFWGGTFVDASRTRPPGEEVFGTSVRGAVRHLLPGTGPAAWVFASVVVGVVGLAVAAWASRRGEELAGILACAVTGLLVSPVTWYAHWVWCVPLLALLAAHTWHRSRHGRLLVVGLWLVFALPLPWWIAYVVGWAPGPERTWVLPVDLLYTLTGVGLLVLAAAWLCRTGPATDGGRQ
ncbi:glycosyltransferase 87 family protein [Micromonospora sp. NPDC093277]|uniref:glycosyltransferase 87 family protein n=1 Tax=Micromonospora sp. NPDC093277 TaxID=3364291 RepID=UPI0037F6EF4C